MRRTAYSLSLLFLMLSLFSSRITNAQDWAGLDVFKKANEQLTDPGPAENRVVFMGNSITIGWLDKVPSFFEGKPYVNRGISGQTTPQMLLRFRQDVLALNPKVVLILAGTNDIAGNTGPMTLQQILDNLISMAELARANQVEPILCSVLPAQRYNWKPVKRPDKMIPELNAMIQAYAASQNLIYVDYFKAMANSENGLDPELAQDGVHPTTRGYKIMAPPCRSCHCPSP